MINKTHTTKDIEELYHKMDRPAKRIGFVPTMGSLHRGHVSLIRQAKAENDLTVCSIFVNPKQFNQSADYDAYPRNIEKDVALLEEEGCDIVFIPSETTMYPQPVDLSLNFGHLESVLEGKYRPGHFNGVGIVVSKLLHMTQPDRVYFGQKDLQQVAVVRHLVDALSFPVEVITSPTVREPEGLAYSSRNVRLSAKGHQEALIFSHSLQSAATLLSNGKPLKEVKAEIQSNFEQNPAATLEYMELVNRDTFEILHYQDKNIPIPQALCIAGEVEGVRLIDNILLDQH